MDSILQFNVSLYSYTPQGAEQLYKQAEMIYYRLRLYQILKTKETLSVDELKSELGDNPLKHLLDVEDNAEVRLARHLDYLSHWTLKIAYSNQQPMFFMKCELRWFKTRFNNMSHDQRMEFIKKNNLNLTPATETEKSSLKLWGQNWYKFNFTEVTLLVKLRLYPMYKGFIFIPEHKLVFWLTEKLQKQLQSSLVHCRKMLPSTCDQLNMLINTFELVQPYSDTTSRRFKLCDLKKNVEHFPLCMKFQYENLEKKHHLKHFSRVQYGLFLKGLGLSLEEALKMWKTEFTKKMSERCFQKEYSYFFKHQYGTVGSKIKYKAQCCDTILEQSVPSGFVHGCPFKHWDASVLSVRLREDDVCDEDVRKILGLKQREQYRAACTTYFQSVCGCKLDDVIDHPVKYYDKSCSSIVDIEDLVLSDED